MPAEPPRNFEGRACQICGKYPIDVVDLEEWHGTAGWNMGEGYCLEHGTEHGVFEPGHAHAMRPGVPDPSI